MLPVRFDLRTGDFTREGRPPLRRGTAAHAALGCLMSRRDRRTTTPDLIAAIYEGAREPEQADRIVVQVILKLRGWLAGTAWHIESRNWSGYRIVPMAGPRLRRAA